MSAVFKTVARRLAPWVGSIPIHSRHPAWSSTRNGENYPVTAATVTLGRRVAVGVGAAAAILIARPATTEGQRADSVRAGVAAAAVRPPLSPRRAFLTSLVAPGYGQAILSRPNAAALFVLTEAVALLMVRETAIELREARRLQDDSVALYFVNPVSGVPDTIYQAGRYPTALVRARRAHFEDWIAALVANHVIAGADAFVAAHLWDVPIRVGFSRDPDGAGTVVSARYRW